MKNLFLLPALLTVAITAAAQTVESRISAMEQLPTADYTYSYTLAIGDTTGTTALANTHDYPYLRKEFEWAVKYATLYSDEGYLITEDCTYDAMRDALDNFASYAYNASPLLCLQALPRGWGETLTIESCRQLSHNRLMQNKTFRKFAFKVAKSFVKEMIQFYPKDYKDKLLMYLNSAITFMQTIPDHRYHIEKIEDGDGYSWIELRDGMESTNPYGMEGIILRRLLINEIPLEELQAMAKELKEFVEAVDVSANHDAMFCYRLNDDIAYVIGCEEPYFISYIAHTETDENNKPHTVYSKYSPFELDQQAKLEGWGCNYNIFITAHNRFQETVYLNDKDGNSVPQTNNVHIYKFLPPTYGLGHCFIENNIYELQIDGMLRIHRKLY